MRYMFSILSTYSQCDLFHVSSFSYIFIYIFIYYIYIICVHIHHTVFDDSLHMVYIIYQYIVQLPLLNEAFKAKYKIKKPPNL